MFLGTYQHTVDPKGRLFIPAKLREQKESSDGRFVLTQGLEACLYLYDAQTFHKNLSGKISNIPVKNQQDARAFKRLLLAGAQDVELDDLGRLLISKPMMDFSGMKRDVSILGVGERIELWSTARWNTYNKKAASTFQRLGKHLEI
jgi:MraZ protein